MAQIWELTIPIICENSQCSNFGNLVNMILDIRTEDVDLFYENYDGSVEEDYCPICGELGVAEEPILIQ